MAEMKNPERKIILMIIITLVIVLYSCGELFPGSKGRINPLDPFCPVEYISLSYNDSVTMIDQIHLNLNIKFRDYDNWIFGDEDDVVSPRFFVVKGNAGGGVSDIEDGSLLWAADAGGQSDQSWGFDPYFDLVPVWNLPPEKSLFEINVSVFWADEYEDSMDTLLGNPPEDECDYSGHWYGPVTASYRIDVVRPAEAGDVTAASKSFGSSILNIGQTRHGILRYDMDPFLGGNYEKMFLFMNIDNVDYGMDSGFTLHVYDMISETWSASDPAADLHDMAQYYVDLPADYESWISNNAYHTGPLLTEEFFIQHGNDLPGYDWKSGTFFHLTEGELLGLSGPESERPPVFLLYRMP